MREEEKPKFKPLNPENEAKFKAFWAMLPLYAVASLPILFEMLPARRAR